MLLCAIDQLPLSSNVNHKQNAKALSSKSMHASGYAERLTTEHMWSICPQLHGSVQT